MYWLCVSYPQRFGLVGKVTIKTYLLEFVSWILKTKHESLTTTIFGLNINSFHPQMMSYIRHDLWIAYNSSHLYQRTLNLPLQAFGGREGSKKNFKIWSKNSVCLAQILKNVALVFLKVSLSTTHFECISPSSSKSNIYAHFDVMLKVINPN